MALLAGEIGALSRLLDEALDLDSSARESWIETVAEPFPGARLLLRKMLEQAGAEGGAGVFDTLPKLGLGSKGSDRDLLSTRLQPGAYIGNYQLEKLIGHGGMGDVWLVQQTAPVRRAAALKLIRAGMYDELTAHRFQAERQSLAMMDHPAIAKVFDAGSTARGQPYLVMEYVPGLPITDYCDQQQLKIRERLQLFIEVCGGVQHAHHKAVIHRDLKPANILIVEVDGKCTPRIIDFGLAKPVAPLLEEAALQTKLGQFLGTPGYMSPEQVDPDIRDFDTRADVYSLGALLYVLLTGMLPFELKGRQRAPLDEWLRQLREEEPPSLSAKLGTDSERAAVHAAACATDVKQLARELRGDLDCIAQKALERDRECRYASPSELSADLRRYLSNEPVLARPTTAGYRMRRFARRHRVGMVVAGMLTLTLAGGLAATSYEARVASGQRDSALLAQSRSLTQTAASRLKDGDVPAALGIIGALLPQSDSDGKYSPAALNVFEEARSADAEILSLIGHADNVNAATFSPDDSMIATASDDNTARLWDGSTGRELRILRGHAAGVLFVSFSPNGRFLATGSRDKTARIWDISTGREIATLSGHASGVWSAIFSPDGSQVVTSSGDKTARVWDASNGRQLAVLAGHTEPVHFAAFSPDGTRIVTSSWDKTARIWDAATGRQLQVLAGHTERLWRAGFSPDGGRVVTCSDDKTARIWEAATGREITLMRGHTSRVMSAMFSPDGRRVMTSSEDASVRLWDADTGDQLEMLGGYGDRLNYAEFSRDGARIVAASYDKSARVWDAADGQERLLLRGHQDRVFTAAFSPDGRRIVSASWDKSARVWDAATGRELATLDGHTLGVVSAMFSSDGRRIVTGSMDTTARLWNAATGEPIATLRGHTGRVWFAAFSPDGKRIVTASDDSTAAVWDAATARLLLRIVGHKERVLNAQFSPDGRRIVTTSTDKTTRLWDAADGRQILSISGYAGVVESAAFSPDGTRIVTASDDKTARIWNSVTGEQVRVLNGHSKGVGWAAYSPDGTRIVTSSFDKTARIWDSASGLQLSVLRGHSDLVETASFSPDGKRIVTASDDRTVRVWDAHTEPLPVQINWASAAQFDPLPSSQRFELGLPPLGAVRHWPSKASPCDQMAAAPYDPDRLAPGVPITAIASDLALAACARLDKEPGAAPRSLYEHGRASIAAGDLEGANRDLTAAARRYRCAQVDLAQLLASRPAATADLERAIALYEQAWSDGVPFAAFALGQLYEHGAADGVGFQADPNKAWAWYHKGADAGEPSALARFAEREESNAIGMHAGLLKAFRFYAAAAERAQEEDWPDDAWKLWRYRRASLARILARAGLMSEVADAYTAARDHGAR